MKACINGSKSFPVAPICSNRHNKGIQNGCPPLPTYLALEKPQKISGQNIGQRRRGKRRLQCSAQADGELNRDDANKRHSWNVTTQRLVAASSIPFALLVLPQVFQNFTAMAEGRSASLAAISWLVCLAAFGISLLTTVINVARLTNLLPLRPLSEGWSLWQCWQTLSGLVVWAALPQVLWLTFVSPAANFAPAITALVLAVSWLVIQVRTKPPAQLEEIVDNLPGWGATVIFALSPLPQLVRNFVSSQTLEGISVGTILLSVLGNSLMVPRALITQDKVWLAGSVWACMVGGWMQLLSLYIGISPSTGARFLEAPVFAAVSLLLVGFFAAVSSREAAAKGHSSLLSSWVNAFTGTSDIKPKLA